MLIKLIQYDINNFIIIYNQYTISKEIFQIKIFLSYSQVFVKFNKFREID